MDKYKEHLQKIWDSWNGDDENILEYIKLMLEIPKLLEGENE